MRRLLVASRLNKMRLNPVLFDRHHAYGEEHVQEITKKEDW